MISNSNESVTSEEQLARFKLREQFLTAHNDLIGEPCNIVTYEKTTLPAVFVGWKPDGSEVLVKELMTPTNIKLDSALLRTPDIISIEFNHTIPLP